MGVLVMGAAVWQFGPSAIGWQAVSRAVQGFAALSGVDTDTAHPHKNGHGIPAPPAGRFRLQASFKVINDWIVIRA
jgi:hypothetical protein